MYLTASSSSTLDVGPVTGGSVLALALLAAVGLAILWRSTAPNAVQPGPTTMDLRDEPPAVVDLLVGGFEVEDDAVPATVVDLAARGWFTIEDYGERTVIRTRHRRPDGDQLVEYEQRVLDHIERHAIDGVVPTPVLTLGPDGVSARWFTGFVREVTRHGRSLGLCSRRWDLTHILAAWALVALAAAPPAIVAGIAPRTSDPSGWGSIGNLLVGLTFVVGMGLVWVAQRISRSDAQVDTPDGRRAAAHWLGVRDLYRGNGRFDDKPAASVAIWDRHLAHATAMGLAPVVQRQIPFETEHDRHLWSRADGTWRRVKVRYQAFRPGWGQHPGRVLFQGLLQGAVSGALAYGAFYVAGADLDVHQFSDDQRRWIGLVGLIAAVILSAAVIFNAVRIVLGVADLFPRRAVEGEVVRMRRFRTGHRLPRVLQWMIWSGRHEHGLRRDAQRRLKHHVAIDPGGVGSIVSNTVRPEIYRQVVQGARVRARVSPLLGYVASIKVLERPRPSAASEPAVVHPVVDETVSKAGGKLAGSLGRAMEHLERATDEQGRPMLDQTDDDGVTMRERLAESRSQIDELRDDPRLANSPVAGLLDTFLAPSEHEEPHDSVGHPEQRND